MVEIEQVKEEEPPVGTKEDTNATAVAATTAAAAAAVAEDHPPRMSDDTDGDDDAFEGWTKLMGKDLLIKVRIVVSMVFVDASRPFQRMILNNTFASFCSPLIFLLPPFYLYTAYSRETRFDRRTTPRYCSD